MTRRVTPRITRAALGILAILGAVGCGPGAADDAGTGSQTPTTPTGPGTPATPLPVANWVEGIDGTIPLVLIAPHGGDLTPADLPDRVCADCVTVNDANTQALARTISDAFFARVGKRPFLVINRLNRRKYDANRALPEATAGYAPLEPMWTLFQATVDSAKARARRLHPRALVIDLHGHAHTVQRLEMGYLLSASQLRLADAALSPYVSGSSVAQLSLVTPARDSGVAILRGPRALGSRFAALGFPAVPSDVDPAPAVGQDYFDGGYNTSRNGSSLLGPVDAVQIECNYTGVRDTAANRAAFAEAFVTALLAFLQDHYAWRPA
jgi:N-formylglutamate amidohydrolase